MRRGALVISTVNIVAEDNTIILPVDTRGIVICPHCGGLCVRWPGIKTGHLAMTARRQFPVDSERLDSIKSPGAFEHFYVDKSSVKMLLADNPPAIGDKVVLCNPSEETYKLGFTVGDFFRVTVYKDGVYECKATELKGTVLLGEDELAVWERCERRMEQ